MRLIDADALIKDIELSRNNNIHREARIKMNHETEHRHFLKIVAEQPTVFDKEKVIAELRWMSRTLCKVRNFNGAACINKAIEVVEKGGVE